MLCRRYTETLFFMISFLAPPRELSLLLIHSENTRAHNRARSSPRRYKYVQTRVTINTSNNACLNKNYQSLAQRKIKGVKQGVRTPTNRKNHFPRVTRIPSRGCLLFRPPNLKRSISSLNPATSARNTSIALFILRRKRPRSSSSPLSSSLNIDSPSQSRVLELRGSNSSSSDAIRRGTRDGEPLGSSSDEEDCCGDRFLIWSQTNESSATSSLASGVEVA